MPFRKISVPRKILIVLCLLIIATAVYWPVKDHDFVHYDDDLYITGNSEVQSGLNEQTVLWALSATDASNWHPLTWLSHLLDVQLYGRNPAGHHVTNLLFHLANTTFLFLVFARMTGGVWRSAFVAALFALHPLHVESVAWVAERKDVLSTFFWILTMWAYLRYVERPGKWRYLLTLLPFALGLMAKPMLVTLPFVLLLLDRWPLRRELRFAHLVREKLPFLALSAVSSIVTFLVQQRGDAVVLLKYLPMRLRITNALVSYVRYIGKTLWPARLSVFYPHPHHALPAWQALGAALVLVCVSLLAIRFAKRAGYLATGWFWFLGTLVPVIGLVQVGDQAIADRYTYVPLIGLFLVVAWGITDLLEGWRHRKKALAVSAGVVLSICVILTWMQLRPWQNTSTLFEHAKRVTADNYTAHRELALFYEKQERFEESVQEYQALIRINPEDRMAHNNLGLILGRLGRLEEGAKELNTAYAIQHFEQGVSFLSLDRFEDARKEFRVAQELHPDYAEARYRRGIAYERQRRPGDALAQYQGAIFLQPEHVDAHNRLGLLYLRNRQIDEAVQEFQAALRINPDFQEARRNLESALKNR